MQTRRGSRTARCGATLAGLVVLICSWGLAAERVAPGNVLGIYSIRTFALLVIASYTLAWLHHLSVGAGRLRQKWAACALSTGAILAILTMLEVPAMLGLLDYRLLLRPPNRLLTAKIRAWEQPGMQYDDELIYRRRPHYELHTETTGNIMSWLHVPTDRRYRLDVSYDSRGFRNDHEIDAAPVVIIGDSFAEASPSLPIVGETREIE